jgi:protein ImuB
LEHKGLGARRLDLICHRVDNRAQAVRVGTGLPLRDTKRMTRLLCDKIETIDPGFGIEVMTLAAIVTEPLTPKQVVSSLVEETEPDVSGLIDLLANRVGERNLYRIAPVASDVPERSVRHIPALAPETGAEWPGHWPRPSRLLAYPEPIDTVALLPDHPPVSCKRPGWGAFRRYRMIADSLDLKARLKVELEVSGEPHCRNHHRARAAAAMEH